MRIGIGSARLVLNNEIVSAQWDADAVEWRLTTDTGRQHTFDVVVSAVGLFTQPVLPDLEEEEPFTGTLMHTARWDHSVDLHDARVAVLGTGSTAAQLVLEVAKVAREVYSITVWLTRCSNYFRAANGRVVTQWPGSARAFWGMTRRFKASDYSFEAPPRRLGDDAELRIAANRR